MKKIVLMLLMCCLSLQCVGHGFRLRYKAPRMPKRSSINYRFSRALERAQHEYVVTRNTRGKITVRETLKRTKPARPLKLRPKEELEAAQKKLHAGFKGVPYLLMTKRQRQMSYQVGILDPKIPFYDKLTVEDIKKDILDYDSRARKHRDPIMREFVEVLKWMINAREKLPEQTLKLRSKEEMVSTSKALYAKVEGVAAYELTERDIQIRCQASVLEKLSMGYDKLEVSHIKEMILEYESAGKEESTMQYIAETLKWIIGAREELPTRPLKLRSKEEIIAKIETLETQASQIKDKYQDQRTPQEIQVLRQYSVLKTMMRNYDELDVSLVEEWMLNFDAKAKETEDPIMRYYTETFEWIIHVREELLVDK